MLMSSYLEKGSLSIRKRKKPPRAYVRTSTPPMPIVFFFFFFAPDSSFFLLVWMIVQQHFWPGVKSWPNSPPVVMTMKAEINRNSCLCVRLTELNWFSSRFYVTLRSGFSANGMNFKIMKHECRSISWPPMSQTSQTSPQNSKMDTFLLISNMKIVFLPFQLANGKLSGWLDGSEWNFCETRWCSRSSPSPSVSLSRGGI